MPLFNSSGRKGIKTKGSVSEHKARIAEKNRLSDVYDAAYEATAVFRGRFDLYVGEVICIKVYCLDGTLHFTSGNYLILEKTDEIGSEFTTTLKLRKNETQIDDNSYKNSNNYTSAGHDNMQFDNESTPTYNASYNGTGPIIIEETVTQGVFVPETSATGLGGEIINTATQYVGGPYALGGDSLTDGCDCSHFVYLILKECGYDVEYMTSILWQNYGEHVDRKDIYPGDILCYNGHVAFYMDGSHIIHALDQKSGITISELDPYSFLGGLVDIRRAVK